jgi:hypothetical protein
MGVIDLLVTIIVVTILVTIALGVMTYIAYKLRLSRRPVSADEEVTGPRFFVLRQPPAAGARSSEGHVTEA